MSRLVEEDTEQDEVSVYLAAVASLQLRVCPGLLRQRFARSLPRCRTQREMRPAEEEDDGMEMGGTLDPEDGLSGQASKARPMPKW